MTTNLIKFPHSRASLDLIKKNQLLERLRVLNIRVVKDADKHGVVIKNYFNNVTGE